MNLNFAVEVKAHQPGWRRFEVQPSEMYPAALADLQDAIRENRAVGSALSIYQGQARGLGQEAWELALVPRDQVTSRAAITSRAQALELARLWFTEHLHQSIDSALELRILKADDWRL